MRKNIIFIEDDTVLRELGSEALRMGGFDVYAAATGGEALALLAGGVQVACLLLDLGLPDMSAEEFLRRFLLLPGAAAIPIVLASGRGDLEDWARRLGAYGVMPKPYDFSTLMRVANSVTA